MVDGLVSGDDWMVSDQDFGELRGQMKAVLEKLDKFDRILFGNGQPGIYEVAKNDATKYNQLNSNIDGLKKDIKEVGSSVSLISANMVALQTTLNDHLKDPRRTFKGFITDNWKNLVFLFVAGFLLLHAILPPGFTLWSLIETIF